VSMNPAATAANAVSAGMMRHPGVRYLERLGARPDLARVLDGYAHGFPLCLFSNPGKWRERARLGTARFLRPNQRPRFYYPHLAAEPWPAKTPWASALEREFEPILAEFRGLEDRLSKHPQENLVEGGAWNLFALLRDGRMWDENCALCPRTTRVVTSLPICTGGAATIYFSVVEPGTRIKPHCGFTNARIRHHLGLEIPPGVSLTVAGEARSWAEGECLVFDDSFLHHVRHDGSVRRVILLVDCWHPDLTPAEIAFVAEIQTLFERPVRA